MRQRVLPALFACIALLMGSSRPSLAQDEAAVVEGLVSARGEAPLPLVGRGAANYSPEQTASFLCEAEDDFLPFLARLDDQRAHEATLAAREVRIRAFRGEATREEMEEAELKRQAAVRGGPGGTAKADDYPGPVSKGLSIEGVKQEFKLENGRRVLVVTGTIRNTTDAEAELPPLTVQALDVRDFMLAGQTSQLDAVTVAAGAAIPFTFRFKNPPQYTVAVKAHFAPPFGIRNFRGCDFFDPLTFDPNQERVRRERAAVTPVPVPKVGAGAPAYTAGELAAMVRRARLDAENAFSFAESAKSCAPMPPWRDLMVMADRMEEAWIATNAAEEVRRDAARGVFLQAEVDQAELARQAAVRAFMDARPGPRVPKPSPHAGLSVGKAAWSGEGTATIRGAVTNGAKERVDAPALLVTLVDRHGFVLTETVHRPGGRIRPGDSDDFALDVALPASLIAEARVVIAC